VAIHPEMRRFAAIVGIVMLLLLLARAFKPDSRQSIDLELTANGAAAPEVELLLIQPSPSSRGQCDGPDPGLIGSGSIVQSKEDGTYHWRRRISPTPIGDRFTNRAARKRAWDLALCAEVDGQWVRLWQDSPREAHRELELRCDLETRDCQARYAPQLDETLRPIVEIMGVGLFLTLLFRGRPESGYGWFAANRFFYVFVQAYAAWLHRYPGVSKAAMVILLIWGAFLVVCLLGIPVARWLGGRERQAS
jgi:hypothetical protein